MSKFIYKKLFKKVIDRDMKNTELMKKAKVSKSTFYKIKNGDNVTTDVLLRICNVLECDISEIVECDSIIGGPPPTRVVSLEYKADSKITLEL